ncbi:MAG: heme exporter protein CcmD [Gammaproteobacteria bacterium PRO9]|nr:heme exporter protein CcmD [Gammaproteobacteria bacterium PRO9]
MNDTFLTSPYLPYLLVAYAVTLLVVAGNIIAARTRLRRVRRRLQAQMDRRSVIGRKVVTEKLS